MPGEAWRLEKATELRRLRSEVEADQVALRTRQAELKEMLAAPRHNMARRLISGPTRPKPLQTVFPGKG
jgi:hypothetical protein